MNRNDWQEAFGPTPDAFRNRVDATLNRLEEREMRRSIKFSTALAAAMLALALLAGAAFAAARLDIWESLQYADPIIPLEGADELVVTDLATAETDYFRVFVQEGVYDGYSAIVKLRFEPKDPEKYAIITGFAVPGDLGDQYIFDFTEYEDGVVDERPLERKDGKEIIYLSTPVLTVAGENAEAKALGLDSLFNSYRDKYNEDGSAEFWISGLHADNLPDALSIALNAFGANREHERVYGEIKQLTFDLHKSNQERIVQLTPVGENKIEGFELTDAKINFTEVCGYITVEYTGSAQEQGMGVTLNLLDSDGNRIPLGDGQCTELDNDHFRWEMEMLSFKEIPETIILEVKMIDSDPVGQIECKVEEITG